VEESAIREEDHSR